MEDVTFAAGVGAASWAGLRWLSAWASRREERLAAIEAKSDALTAECQGLRDQVSRFQAHEKTLLEKIDHLESALVSCQKQLERCQKQLAATTQKLREAMDQIQRHQSRSIARRAWDYLCG